MHQQPETYSFVLRIWLEDPPTESGGARWRGRITNVLDERSKAVQDFEHLEQFVREYLDQWNDRPPTA